MAPETTGKIEWRREGGFEDNGNKKLACSGQRPEGMGED
jgi:hypothetical protein